MRNYRLRALSLGVLLALALTTLACGKKEGSKASLPTASQTASQTASPSTDTSAPPAQQGNAVETAASTEGTSGNSFFGTTEPHRRSTISPMIAGTIVEIMVHEGVAVKRGQVLLRLDSELLEWQLKQAQAAVKLAKVAAEAAASDHKRAQQLVADNAMPKSQLETLDFRVREATLRIEQAEINEKLIAKNIADTRVVAPYNGVIARRLVSEGEYATVAPPKNLFIIEETDLVVLRLQIAAKDAGRIRVGSTVLASFEDLGIERRGKISRINASADPQTRNFSALIDLQNGDGKLMPGLFARVSLTGENL